MAFTEYAKTQVLKELVGVTGTAFDFNKMYLGLFSTVGTSYVELDSVTAPGYSRKLIGDPNYQAINVFPTPTSGSVTNDVDIMFGRATGTWPTVTGAGLFNSVSGGNNITQDALSSNLSGITTNWVVVIPAGSCTISFN